MFLYIYCYIIIIIDDVVDMMGRVMMEEEE